MIRITEIFAANTCSSEAKSPRGGTSKDRAFQAEVRSVKQTGGKNSMRFTALVPGFSVRKPYRAALHGSDLLFNPWQDGK